MNVPQKVFWSISVFLAGELLALIILESDSTCWVSACAEVIVMCLIGHLIGYKTHRYNRQLYRKFCLLFLVGAGLLVVGILFHAGGSIIEFNTSSRRITFAIPFIGCVVSLLLGHRYQGGEQNELPVRSK